MRTIALALLVAAVVTVSWRWGSFVAGGSDSYCYLHQAERWADAMAHPFGGRLQVVEPLALEAPWPDAPLSFTPIGHLPSAIEHGAIVPICPPGLSIAMAPFVLAGGSRAAFAAIPLFAAILIVATYGAGARFGTATGLSAALVTAASPVFLYQAVQPMSDVAAAALWMLTMACATGTKRRHLVMAGLAASGAILIRPNLVPLGVVVGLFLLFRAERTWTQRIREAAIYAAWCAPGCVAVALVQSAFYGSPLVSGYGSFADLFAAGNVGPNLRRYLTWLWQSQTPLIALALLAPALLPGRLTMLFLGMFVMNLALYLPYIVFDDWSFLRFLLPTLPMIVILMMASLDAVWRRARLRGHGVALAVASLMLSIVLVGEARDRNAFRLQAMEARFERAGSFVAERLPANAMVFTAWESGSIRFYSGRKTLAWHGLHPEWLDRAIADVSARGYEPYLLFERWEEQEFRERFPGSPLGALDWPPAFEISTHVRIYRPGDRERYLSGTAAPTEYVR
jgi:hypothetical protein